MAKLFTFTCGTTCSRSVINMDYSYYLGPNYKEGYKEIQKTSTVVCNHISWIDTMCLYQYYKLAFSLDIGFKRVPLMGKLGDLIDSIYLPRGSSQEKRDEALKRMTDRQELIEKTGNYAPLLVFAEGATTNGSGLMKFKKGAFISERRC